MRYLRPHMNFATIVSILALLIGSGSAAYAAIMITGASVKDGAITGGKIKDGSLTTSDLSSSARTTVTGGDGPRGVRGDKGATGPAGQLAKLTSSWASRNTGLVTDSTSLRQAPNTGWLFWDDLTYGAANVDGEGAKPNIRTTGNYVAVDLNDTWQPVLALNGMTLTGTNATGSAQGMITLPWSARLTATATMSLLHRRSGDDAGTQDPSTGTEYNTRAACKLAYGTNNTYTSFTTMGTPMYSSSDLTHQLTNLSLVADVDTSAALLPAGSYNIAVLCRDPDYTGQTEWSIATASMTAMASG